MNIAIYTCRFGSGHRQAAHFIEEMLGKQDHQVVVNDVMEKSFPLLHRAIYRNFQNIMRKRNWRLKLYLKADQNKTKVVPRLNILRKRFFAQLDREALPDAFVATYSIVAHLLSEYKRIHHLNIPLITCITDFAPHEIWLNQGSDLYLVASQACKKQLSELGVRDDQMIACGLAAADASEKAQPIMRTERLKILISGGGLGLLPSEIAFYRQLRDYFQADVRVVCGSNQKQRRKLELAGLSRVETFSYVDNMRQMLLWADLFVGKPGGISTFEAILAETPIAFLSPYLPQEKRNARFILENQIGFEYCPPERFCDIFQDLDSFDRYRRNMKRQKQNLEPQALIHWLAQYRPQPQTTIRQTQSYPQRQPTPVLDNA